MWGSLRSSCRRCLSFALCNSYLILEGLSPSTLTPTLSPMQLTSWPADQMPPFTSTQCFCLSSTCSLPPWPPRPPTPLPPTSECGPCAGASLPGPRLWPGALGMSGVSAWHHHAGFKSTWPRQRICTCECIFVLLSECHLNSQQGHTSLWV